MPDVSAELSEFFEAGEVDATTFDRLGDLVLRSFQTRERFAELLAEYGRRVSHGQGEALKLALGLLVLGRYQEALEWFGKAPEGQFRRLHAARAALALGRYDQAVGDLEAAAAKGGDRFEVDMQVAAIHARAGELARAEKLSEKHAQAGRDRADWYYVRGLLSEQRGDWPGAAEQFEKALKLEPEHVPAKFRCARLYDTHGDDAQAVELYEALAQRPCTHVNALINLAVIYEDRGEYNAALECLQRVLKAYPNHTRARLFLKDVESCRQMVLVEAGDERGDRRSRLLDTPISEFELSVRARNCLKKMSVRTLGDLAKLTEADLLSFKNFGETSLTEIKALLAKRGLRLGRALAEAGEELPEVAARVNVPPGREAVLLKPVSELELSVRARRCLQRLNVTALGDLVQLTEAELLGIRNFGQTSLNEVKTRLAEHGLQLAPRRVD